MSVKLTDADALKAVSDEHGYLRQSGWIESYISRRPVDAAGNPIPWYTYAAIEFLKPKITKHMSVYEFGSGHSTLWYAARVMQVCAVEDNPKWHEIISARLPKSVIYNCKPEGEFAKDIYGYSRTFDVIAIDGAERVNCAKNCIHALREGGVVVFDNSTDAAYREAYEFLKLNGFRRIDFHGLTPICTVANCTSIFYKNNNCMGI